MKTLHLTLMKKWFDEIKDGLKKIEYRDIKPYWTKRFFDKEGNPKHFDNIFFRNGYGKNARSLYIEFKEIVINNKTMKYEIMLGEVLK